MRLRNDLDLYERQAADWWNERSRFAASLHGVNRHRLAQVRARLGGRLPGLRIVDLGCGGGLMSEPLARAGALVTGCDLSQASLAVAVGHGRGVPGLTYLAADARAVPLADGCADLVLLADVVEHIDGWRTVVAEAARLLAPGGLCYVNTLNRTRRAAWLAVHIAEGLGLVPRGTHDPEYFVTPGELAEAAVAAGLRAEPALGQRLRVWRTLCEWRVRIADGPAIDVGYSAWLSKDSVSLPTPR